MRTDTECSHPDEVDITRFPDPERVYLCPDCDSVRTEDQ